MIPALAVVMTREMQPLGILKTVHQTLSHEELPTALRFYAQGKWLSPLLKPHSCVLPDGNAGWSVSIQLFFTIFWMHS
jgi:hypothetical protein